MLFTIESKTLKSVIFLSISRRDYQERRKDKER